MKRGVICIMLICLLLASLILESCSKSTVTTTPTSTNASTPTQTTKTTTAITQTNSTITATTTTAVAGNWWDSLGKPQYGGTITLRMNRDIANFDPYNSATLTTINCGWMEKLATDDWTVDPTVFDFKIAYRPSQYENGNLAESWEFTDPNTIVFHLRQGIYWQNIPPANGRKFTGDDVVYHYDRLLGLGDGFTKPAPYYATVANWQALTSVTATDKYTVAFKWKTSNPEFIMDTMLAVTNGQCIEAPEAVQEWGNLNDWHHAIGTGPFILTDFVSSGSATLVKNPNYWGYDERYSENQLPYINTLKILIISDDATTLAGLRTGKIDVIDGVSIQNARAMQKTNPEILQIGYPLATAVTIDPRDTNPPFNDIRVREAMQMAIDLPTLASSYYGGTSSPYPQTLTTQYMTGWGFPYAEWPQDLKDQYAYNPMAAKQLLAAAGYPNGFKTNIVVDAASDMDLLQVVKSYFANIGIAMDIQTMDSASWSAFVLTAHKNDALATRPTGILGITSDPISQLLKFQTGYSANDTMVSDPVFDAFYTKAMTDTSVSDIKQLVKDANEYVARQHYVISLLQPMTFGLCQPWLKGYNGQMDSISGPGVAPLLLGFYTSRFWIDQNLKKSMGH